MNNSTYEGRWGTYQKALELALLGATLDRNLQKPFEFEVIDVSGIVKDGIAKKYNQTYDNEFVVTIKVKSINER